MEYVIVIILSALYVAQYVVIMIMGIRYMAKDFADVPTDKSVSVIIPFRNEEARFNGLLQSINSCDIPKGIQLEFIFVNDGSTDNGAAVISDKLNKPFKIIDSPGKGKKAGIRAGVAEAQFEYILTWDADISFGKEYFNAVWVLDPADMWVLPVKMTGNSLLQRLGSLDFSWLQIATYATAKTGKPILANGANLFFSKSKFMKAEEIRDDKDLASGDDVFLLGAFEKMGAVIRASNNPQLQVSTPAPTSLRMLLAQRNRWAGKIGRISSNKHEALMFMFIATQFFMIGAWMFMIQQQNIYYFVPLGIKFFNEFLVTQMYSKGRTFVTDIIVVFIAQFWMPVYLLLTTIASSSGDNRWEINRTDSKQE